MPEELKEKFKLNLQLHAEPPVDPPKDPTPEPTKEPPADPPKDPEKDPEERFTRKDLNALIATAVKKAQDEAKAEIEEQKRLSKLSAEEKASEELKRLQEELDGYKTKEAYNNALEDTKKELEERKLPLGFADFLVNSDSAKALEHIKAFEKAYKEDVQKAVEERLKNPNPPKNHNHGGTNAEDELRKAFNLPKPN